VSREQRLDALLEGWGEPAFPTEMLELDRALAAAGRRVAYGLSGGFLNGCAGPIRGFVQGLSFPQTSDGYCWFWGLEWALPAGRVRLLIPMRVDKGRQDGSSSDRSPALYTQGVENIDSAIALIRQFIENINRL
jgi:hypothetical protein